MNDNDLERQLRSQHGPREAGYTPAQLPMTLDDSAAASANSSRVGRAGLLVGVGMAGALAVAVVAGILSGPGSGPDVGRGNSTEPSAAATLPETACGLSDVALTAEAWGGAAGSRGTVVTVSLAPGRYECMLAPVLEARISDAAGLGVVSGEAVNAGAAADPVSLTSTAAYTVGVAWSEWCGDPIAEPVGLAIGFDGWPTLAPVTVASGGSAVPPCEGTQPTNLSVTSLEAR